MLTCHLYGKLKGVHRARRLLPIAPTVAVAVVLAACGGDERPVAAVGPPPSAPQPVDRLVPHPRAVDPSAGVPVTGSRVVASTDADLPRPQSDAEIRRALAASGIPSGDVAALTGDGLAVAPLGAPAVVQSVIHAGNQIARLPYRYGGGHATWIDTAYDCSASISFAFAAAGLIGSPMVSGQLAQWGEPGPGRWITVYAHGGHAFMEVAGLRFDTSGLRETGSRWQTASRSTAGFALRHPPGL